MSRDRIIAQCQEVARLVDAGQTSAARELALDALVALCDQLGRPPASDEQQSSVATCSSAQITQRWHQVALLLEQGNLQLAIELAQVAVTNLADQLHHEGQPFERYSWEHRRHIATSNHLNVGTIGHLGHGKTTLTAQITQVLAATSSTTRPVTAGDILDRGQRIHSDHGVLYPTPYMLEYSTPGRHYTHLDCPGHPDFTKNVASAMSQLDAAILVVSAARGVEAQTVEHLLMARGMGVGAIIVWLSHCDTDPELIEVAELEVRGLFERAGCSGRLFSVIRGPTRSDMRRPVLDLVAALDVFLAPPRDTSTCRMQVWRSFSIAGRGTIVVGRVDSGLIRVGDVVELVGIEEPTSAVVESIRLVDHPVEQADAGDLASCLLEGVERWQVHRGQVVATPGTCTPCRRFRAEIKLHSYARMEPTTASWRAPGFSTGWTPQFHIGSVRVTGRIATEGAARIVGELASVTVDLVWPIVLTTRRFIISEGRRLIGEGTITSIL